MAFDADDTLWDTQSYYDNVEHKLCLALSAFGNESSIRDEIYATENANMKDLGFGAQAFTLSLIETAIRVSSGETQPTLINKIIIEGKALMNIPSTPLPGVIDTLEKIRCNGKYYMVIFTKGNPLDQENKIERSGLGKFFDKTVIVSDKTEKEYNSLCKSLNIKPEEFVMIGNSYKSDISPVLGIGGYGIHIPYGITCHLETADGADHDNLFRAGKFEGILPLIP